MSPKIKDLVEVAPSGNRSASGRGLVPPGLETFLLSYEMGDVIARTVERLASTAAGPHNCLIVGGPGCGKSRLLEAVASLFEAGPEAHLHPRLAEIRALAHASRSHVVRVRAASGERHLAPAIAETAYASLEAAGFPVAWDPSDRINALAALRRFATVLPSGVRLIVAVDDVDTWLAAGNTAAEENALTLVEFGEISGVVPVSFVIAAGEYVITHDSSTGGQGWISALLDSYRIEYVPARALRSATASNILVKNARQRREINDVLAELRTKLPELPVTDEEFVELYPLEVSTWGVGSHLHRWIPEFSFPEFAARAAESVRRRPAASLFALNDMFTLFEPQLRHVEELGPIFEAYDRLVLEAIPRLGQNQRLWGRLALQSIFMHSIAGISADVRTITNSVLLYDLHGGVSSYTMMSAVLRHLETLDAGQLVATGDGTARRYGLVTGEREALRVRIEALADTIEADDEASLAIVGVGGQVFADWPISATPAGRNRTDLWNIGIADGLVTLTARALEGEADAETANRPRIVLFPPGRAWSEAGDLAKADPLTACWIVSKPSFAERSAMRQWLAAVRLAADEGSRRHPDLPSLLTELEAEAVAAFRRVYVDGGTLVTRGGREAISDFVTESRAETLVVRMLPAAPVVEPVEIAPGIVAAVAPEPEPASDGAAWIGCIVAADRDESAALAGRLTASEWLGRLESWYGTHVGRDDSGPVRMLGERGNAIPEVAAALDARQRFNVVLYYVRRALGSRSVGELGEEISHVFESQDAVWEARERLGWLESFARWLPTLDEAAQYLNGADVTDDEDLESLRTALLDWMDRLDEFVNERRRSAFTHSFDAYRDEYARIYTSIHDRSVGAAHVDRLSSEIVESAAWETLEALSSLTIGNPSYLVDAINLISALRDAQCSSGVDASLRTHPQCACGFRFADRDRLATMAGGALDFVQMGIDHHLRLLQARRNELKTKLMHFKTSFNFDTIRSIADLTKEAAPLRVEPATVEAINFLLDASGEWAAGSADEPRALLAPTDTIM